MLRKMFNIQYSMFNSQCLVVTTELSFWSMEKKYDLEERLVNYTCRMIYVVEALPGTRAGNYIAGQLIKSYHSPTFSYGEAQAAESREDFIHKLGVVLKELRWFLKNSILSFPCKRESIVFKNLWIPTFVGMTIYRSLLKRMSNCIKNY